MPAESIRPDINSNRFMDRCDDWCMAEFGDGKIHIRNQFRSERTLFKLLNQVAYGASTDIPTVLVFR
jgi:hypothetical protein